ncbi:MAG TPA: TonB-dependent receptor [Stellaceae bacterium]|jgi:vitamin B12 transporter
MSALFRSHIAISLVLASIPLADLLFAPIARAQDASSGPTPITINTPITVIGATRNPTPEDQLGTSVTVITGDQIDQKQQRTLPEVLQDVPGLSVVQTGSPGGLTSVFMRGTDPNHTKVLVDGVDVGDPTSTDGSFDFSQLLASDIDRVEVVRGPQSGLYGSDAIGGVINIITKAGKGPPKATASIEGGSFGTFNQTAGISGSQARFNYDASIAHYRTTNTQVTPSNLVPPGRSLNDDFYDNKTYATKLGANLTDNFDVGVVARYVDTDLRSTFDDFVGPEDICSDSSNHSLFTRGTAHLALFDGLLDQTMGYGYTNYRRRIFDPNAASLAFGNDPGYFRGDRAKLDYQGNVHVMTGQIVTFGAEHERDTLNDSSPATGAYANNAGFVQLQSSFGDRFFNTASVRYDSNSEFGDKATYRIAPATIVPETDTTFRGSIGTGFKAPSLDQLFDSFPAFGFFANPNLQPETSLGWDAGVEQKFLDRRASAGATYFHNDIKNLIADNDTFTTLINVGHATTYGVESFVAYKPWDVLSLRADYTYTVARNDVTGAALTRRPKHKASLNATWQVTERASLSGAVLYTGPWIDSNRDGTATGLTASRYTIVNIAGSYDLGHGVTAFARIDNLTDRRYQDPIGFQHQGLGVFGGVKVTLDAASLGGWGG